MLLQIEPLRIDAEPLHAILIAARRLLVITIGKQRVLNRIAARLGDMDEQKTMLERNQGPVPSYAVWLALAASASGPNA